MVQFIFSELHTSMLVNVIKHFVFKNIIVKTVVLSNHFNALTRLVSMEMYSTVSHSLISINLLRFGKKMICRSALMSPREWMKIGFVTQSYCVGPPGGQIRSGLPHHPRPLPSPPHPDHPSDCRSQRDV